MPQTPISATADFASTTPTTLYTAPAGGTAVVRSVLVAPYLGSQPTVTINKRISGVDYPIVYNAATTATSNALAGPVTLGQNESLTISTSTGSSYKFKTDLLPSNYPNDRITNIAYFSSGQYVAVGFDNSTGVGLIFTSSDAITWTQQTFTGTISLTDVAFDGTNYVVVGRNNGGYVYYSTNLSSWTAVATGATNDMYCITYGNSKFVAGGSGGRILHATTPTSWTSLVPTYLGQTLSNDINTILTIGTSWAFGSTLYFYSSNLTSFTVPLYTPTSGWAYAVGASGVLLNGYQSPSSYPTSSLQRSADYGVTWSLIDLTGLSYKPNNPMQYFACNNGGYVGVPYYYDGANPQANYFPFIYSSDSTSWTYGQFYKNYADTAYATSLYPVTNSQGNLILMYESGQVRLRTCTVASSGVLADQSYVSLINTYFNPSGGFTPIGSGNASNNWVVAVNGGSSYTDYINLIYASSVAPSSSYTAYAWYAGSYGYPYCGSSRAASAGYIVGTSTGYVGYSTANSGTFAGFQRPFGNANAITALICTSIASASSPILAINSAGQCAITTDGGVTWVTKGTCPVIPVYSNYRNDYIGAYSNGYYIIRDSSGNWAYSTDAITWTSSPVNIRNSYNLNSLNIFLTATGFYYTAGTSLTSFTVVSVSGLSISNHPSIRSMVYVAGQYVYGGPGMNIYVSTDLATWTQKSVNSTSINNVAYVNTHSSDTLAIAYSGAGSNIVVGSAARIPTANNVSIGQPTSLAAATQVGAATAGVVQIT